MTTLADLWRASRDLLVALAGLVLAICTRTGGVAANSAWEAWGLLFLSGLACRIVANNSLPENPVRAVKALEGEVGLLYSSLSILPFAGVFLGLGILSSRFSDTSEKYWFGAASGFILGGISAALIQPGKSMDWMDHRVENAFQKAYAQKFYVLDDDGNPIPEDSPDEAIWSPRGVENEALSEVDYDDAEAGRVEGWDFKNRRARARTLERGLKKALNLPQATTT